jgi:hypothetical protein
VKPYEYDQPGCDVQMTIGPNLAGEARLRILSGHPTVYIDISATAVPAAALALYEAAGLPEPVILPNPELVTGTPLAIGTPDRKVHVAGHSLWLENGHLHIEAYDRSGRFTRDSARLLAAAIAVHADLIPEPDRAEVEGLAVVIEAEDYGLDYESRWGLARAILLGGWKREPDSARLRLPVRLASRRTPVRSAPW